MSNKSKMKTRVRCVTKTYQYEELGPVSHQQSRVVPVLRHELDGVTRRQALLEQGHILEATGSEDEGVVSYNGDGCLLPGLLDPVPPNATGGPKKETIMKTF